MGTCRIPAINMAGVTWVIKLQLLLLCFLLLAVIDFFLGSLFTSDAGLLIRDSTRQLSTVSI
jgi:hypothetical protein